MPAMQRIPNQGGLTGGMAGILRKRLDDDRRVKAEALARPGHASDWPRP